MVRAGEAGGMVGEALSRLETFLEKSVTLKSNIRSAMVYPTILFMVGASAVVILITFVVPQFAKLFEDMGAALPLPTQVLMGVSALIIDYWPALLLTILIGVGTSGTFGPMIASVSLWFVKRRGIAMSLVASGSYIAGTMWPPLVRYLSDSVGWRDTHLIIGAICVTIMVPVALFLRGARLLKKYR